MRQTVKTDTSLSFAFNQMYKFLAFKFRKIVILFVRQIFVKIGRSSEYNFYGCITSESRNASRLIIFFLLFRQIVSVLRMMWR